MIVKVTSKRQVTFPKRMMEKFNIKEGDALSVSETADGILIRPKHFLAERLAPLREKIDPLLPPPDYHEIRHAALDPKLRA
jgi:AbrB family looped-hinge helix DNA binding protein